MYRKHFISCCTDIPFHFYCASNCRIYRPQLQLNSLKPSFLHIRFISLASELPFISNFTPRANQWILRMQACSWSYQTCKVNSESGSFEMLHWKEMDKLLNGGGTMKWRADRRHSSVKINIDLRRSYYCCTTDHVGENQSFFKNRKCSSTFFFPFLFRRPTVGWNWKHWYFVPLA